MKNPFKNNSLASFLMGIIVGTGGCMGIYAITEPENPNPPQEQIARLIGTPTAENENQQQQQQQQTVGEKKTEKPSQEQTDQKGPATNNNAEMISTRWYQGEKYHGLEDNPNGDVKVTPAGKRYHRPSCPSVEGHDFIKATKSDAENAGLTPCKKCKP